MRVDRPLPRAQALAARLLHAALSALKDAAGPLPVEGVFAAVEARVSPDGWASRPFARSGHRRWESLLHFHSVDAVKAGYLIKARGLWHLTAKGREALALGDVALFLEADRSVCTEGTLRAIAEAQDDDLFYDLEASCSFSPRAVSLEQAQSLAHRGLRAHLERMGPYQFQDLVAALLRAMGYHTPFVAPRGKDGGVDILAYRDPLGALTPRVKVQVKHRHGDPARVAEVRGLMGVLAKEGDTGLFVSSGGFTADARACVRNAHVHVELVDRERLLDLWREFFPRMPESDQRQLPLVPVWFAGH